MLRKGVAAKIWTKIWDSGVLVGGGRLLRRVFGTSIFSNFPKMHTHSVIEVSEFLFVILF